MIEMWQSFVDGVRNAASAVADKVSGIATRHLPCPTKECRDNNHSRNAHGEKGCLCAIYNANGTHRMWCPCTKVYG